jgi:CDP-glycerol glycerophosphotransferase (TagB/SpsB family)
MMMKRLFDFSKKITDYIFAVKLHRRFCEDSRFKWVKSICERAGVVYIEPDEDVYPYLAITGILVTDYSSIYYDYLISGRPIVFFKPDVAQYTQSRQISNYEFEQDIEVGPTFSLPENLIEAIEEAGSDLYSNNCSLLAKKFHSLPHDGLATKRAAEFICSILRV